ncbi:Uncharacterised protein [Ralstonia pickettii]|jgi:hypothetical protein|nr:MULTISPECIES: hypothetical protein [Ralstonia]EGY62935.2 hypothetical protein HMPREF0989_03430 [Ralstonia sp. 5_2_56FAA]MBU6521489.1 hypothetical protein [Ralstonia sp. B265]NPT50911.1 hypothetical protein [Ralstonia sp. 3N]QQK34443.1 hypothetical protein RP6297_00627 [Ralstonia pickettii]UCA15210.1 hypothetical protein LA354_04215 [Ralstonia pickettii]
MSTPEYPLAGKRVLIMSPRFFGYENAIADAARALGAHTIVVLDKPSNTIWTKAATRVFPSAVASRMMEYVRSMQDRYGYQGFDEIIVIKGEALTAGAVHLLRESFPNARCIYYNWDSLRNYPHLREILPQFDACFSFDPEDCASTKGLKHLPLFYVDEYRDLPAELVQYELFAVASLHSDRYEVTRKVMQACPADARALTYFFFPSLVALMGKKFLEPNLVIPPLREINWRPMSKDAMLQGLARSRAVIDIQHPNQTGLTMRTIEMIGARRKLITTNALVKSYDFYDKNNIAVVDRVSPVIPSDFLSTDYVAVRQDIRKKYSIHAWLAVLLGLQPLGVYRNGGG